MMKAIIFTISEEEYAFLEKNFEMENAGIHFDYCEGPLIDVLNRACDIIDNDKDARVDFLKHKPIDLVLWYLHCFQDQNGIPRTFTDVNL